MATDGKDRSLKKRHLGIAGILTVLMQYQIGVKNDEATQKALEAVVETQRAQLETTMEREFVRKSELDKTLNKLDAKLDQVDRKLDDQGSKISRIEGHLKKSEDLTESVFDFTRDVNDYKND